LARASVSAFGLRVVTISVGEPGARWMTQKLMTVMPRKTAPTHRSLMAMRRMISTMWLCYAKLGRFSTNRLMCLEISDIFSDRVLTVASGFG